MTLIIFILAIILMILSIIFIPSIKIKKITIKPYYIITMFFAIVLILLNKVTINDLLSSMLQDTSINPLKILTLFISMAFLSIYLDEIGFFKYVAGAVLEKTKSKQIHIFLALYIVTSILTVFTSNDIIILTFTPFICYFCKHAKINPIPYLLSEFVSANTWSMMLLIGNPTNIFICNAFDITFYEYFKTMFIPTIFSSLVAFLIIYLLFRKDLNKEIDTSEIEKVTIDKTGLIIGLVHLGLCTIFLAISSYINIQMYLVSLTFALSLLFFVLIKSIINKNYQSLTHTVKRAPFNLIPFLLSMFILILALDKEGYPKLICDLLENNKYIYGYSSMLSSNIMNNIPMCVLFSSILNCIQNNLSLCYSVIIGSNIGAILSPIGALAGIMWMSILKTNGVKYSFSKFLLYGIIITPVVMFVSLMLL